MLYQHLFWNRLNKSRFLFCLVCFCWGTVVLQAEETRTWSDASGKFKIQGKFVSVDKGKVTLEKTDGSEMEIDLKKLSAADQKYVADQEKMVDNPFKSKDEPPAKGDKKPKAKPEKPEKSGSSEARVILSKIASAKVVPVVQPKTPWKFEVPKLPDVPSAGRDEASLISLPGKLHFFDKVQGIVASPGGTFAGVCFDWNDWDKKYTTHFAICNLATGEQVCQTTVEGLYHLLAVHDDGKQLLVRREDKGSKDRLEFWTVSGNEVTKGQQWIPYDEAKDNDREIQWATYLSDDRLMTVGHAGHLVTWSLEEFKPLYKTQIKGNPTLSPDQKWLAFVTDKEVGILDVDQGKLAALAKTVSVNSPKLAFSPKQQRLALGTNDRLMVLDFATGKLYREVSYVGMKGGGGEFTFASEDHVVVAKRYLIDLESQVQLWEYQGAEHVQQIAGVTWFLVIDGEKPAALLGSQLPPPTLMELLEKSLMDPEIFVYKPGASIKVDVSKVDPAGQDLVKKGLIAHLKDLGLKLNPEATLEIRAETEMGPEEKVDYRSIGRRGSDSFMVKNFISRLRIVHDGRELWLAQINSRPNFLHLQQNETMEQHLRKSEKFNFEWFGTAELPKLLQKPSSAESIALGVTKLTTKGAK